MTSSLRNITNPDFSNPAFFSRVNEILLGTFKWNYVLLEGKIDLLILEKFFSDKVKPINTGSKNNVKKMMEIISKSKTNVIGICDLDYDKPDNSSLHIFYYDFNNLEMMLIQDDSIFYDDAFSFLGIDACEIIQAKKDTLIELYPLSIFRRIKSSFGLMGPVDDVCPSTDLYKRQTPLQNATAIEYNILNRLTELPSADRINIAKSYRGEYLKTPMDFYGNTRGHDFIKLFCEKVNCQNESLIYDAFSKSFLAKYLTKTSIYLNIKKYEKMEIVSFLLI